MSDSILSKLVEMFPDVSVEFLSGICKGQDDQATIEDLIEVILSFEFRPPRESDKKDCSMDTVSDCSLNGSVSVESEDLEPEALSFLNSPNVDRPVQDELLRNSAPICKDNMPYNGKQSSLEESDVERSGVIEISVSNRVLNGAICEKNELGHGAVEDGCKDTKQNFKTELNVFINPGMQLYQSEMKSPVLISYSKNHKRSNEEEDDSSPECSIKYLMEGCNIETQSEELGENLKENKASASDSKDYSKHSPLPDTNTSNIMMSHGEYSGVKQKITCQPENKSICSNLSRNGSSPASHSSNKRATLRSSKVKNEEARLRRRLINQSKYERQKNFTNTVMCPSQFLDMDKKYSLLCKIFSDASPSYLLDQCKLLTNQEQILAFISRNLELRDYPKIEMSQKEPNLMEEFHCSVADFLDVIPDPVVEFSSANYIRAGYEENAEIYLRARYNGVSIEDIKHRLSACSYNLLAVCTMLEDEGRIPTPGVLDYTPLHHPANVFFHQEVWYIEHRKEVQDYLDSALEAIQMQNELEPPPPPPEEVFECEICRDEIVEYINLGTCDGRKGHLFCVNCIKRSAEVRIGDGEITFPCLVNCGSLIPLRTVQELLPKNVFDKLMGRIQEEEIRMANIAGVETCPFCPYAYGPGEEAKFTCLNPECMKLSCRICRKEEHYPELCEMFKNEDEERARLIIENRMAEALMRTCYSCGKNFVKSGGCNKMECTCGAKMCYVCRKPVTDYSHFNGQGGDHPERCPLFSADNELHDRPVEATAEQVFNEIAANNPQLNLERAKLIPK